MTLNPKQQRFVEEYLLDLNATQAAIRSGYSPRTANEQGCRLLANVKVAAAIAEAKEARSAETGIDARWVLLRAVAMHEKCVADDDNANAIRALDVVGKHVDVQAFRERVEHSGLIQTEDVTARADEFTRRVAGLATAREAGAGASEPRSVH